MAKKFIDYLPRAIENIILVVGLFMVMGAVAAPLNVVAQGGGQVTFKDVVYGATGLAVALIAAWSKRQDKDIAAANQTAASALKKAHEVELIVVEVRARQDSDDRFRDQ